MGSECKLSLHIAVEHAVSARWKRQKRFCKQNLHVNFVYTFELNVFEDRAEVEGIYQYPMTEYFTLTSFE
jgi:hypothetical protein